MPIPEQNYEKRVFGMCEIKLNYKSTRTHVIVVL
jgi:hypothetical protein